VAQRHLQRFLEHAHSLQMKHNIFQHCTGTLLNQKYTFNFRKSTSLQCPLCQLADTALRILSGCLHTIISGMIIEGRNVAWRRIMKVISRGSLAGCLVHLDAGSTNRLAHQYLRIPEHASCLFVCYKTRADTAMSLRQARQKS